MLSAIIVDVTINVFLAAAPCVERSYCCQCYNHIVLVSAIPCVERYYFLFRTVPGTIFVTAISCCGHHVLIYPQYFATSVSRVDYHVHVFVITTTTFGIAVSFEEIS